MTEHDAQVTVIQYCQLMEREYPELEMLFAIPNGGDRHPKVAAKLKAEGVKRGVPDLCLPVPRGRYHGLYIELKAGKGRPTKEQKEWLHKLTAQGYLACLCVGADPAIRIIMEYVKCNKPEVRGTMLPALDMEDEDLEVGADLFLKRVKDGKVPRE